MMLEVSGLGVDFGGVTAVADATFELHRSEVLGLIGPNGAGKSTTVNAICGAIRPTRGRVVLEGHNLVGKRPHQIALAGIARTFQQAQLWTGMSVEQHLALPQPRPGWGNAQLRVREVADAVGITSLLGEDAGALPYGTRRLVEVARAMMLRPRVLILDEPAAGLSHAEKRRLAAVLADLSTTGVATLLIDHDMGFVMTSCPRLIVLDAGRVIAQGTPEEIRNDSVVQRSYIGGGLDHGNS